MIEDHGIVKVRNFRGRWARGSANVCPPEYAFDEQNIEFVEGSIKSRSGFDSFLQLSGDWSGIARRIFAYKRTTGDDILLILDNAGTLYRSNGSSALISLPAATDFSAVNLYNRCYLTFHDGDKGIPGGGLYVYEGGTGLRIAGGAVPAGYDINVVDSATTGIIEQGIHLFSVAYENVAGHITSFGLNGNEVQVYTAPGNKKADISGIPTAVPSEGIVARHIIVTGVIKDYDGNPKDKDWFFLPNGRIPDNVTTVLNGVDFYDADLIKSAEYLQNQLAVIPSGSCIATYENRLVVGSEIANPATIRISSPGDPESFSGLDGFLNVEPGDAGGSLHHLIGHRGLLYMYKDHRTYLTKATLDPPTRWEVVEVDSALGTSVHGSAGVLDSKGHHLDEFLICSRPGLYLFRGTYGAEPELSYAIEDIWRRINQENFKRIEIAIDPILKLIRIVVPLDGATNPDTILYCDYSEGLHWDKVKWSVWKVLGSGTKQPSTCWIAVDFTTKVSKFYFGAENGGIYLYNSSASSDAGTAGTNPIVIPSHYEHGPIPSDRIMGDVHIAEVKINGNGNGNLGITLSNQDLSKVITPFPLTFTSSSGRNYPRKVEFLSNKTRLKFVIPDSLHLFLSALWNLDEASGTRLDTRSTNNLTDNNTVGQTSGKIGNAALFVAANSEYLSITDGAQVGLNPGLSDFSISLWFYPIGVTGSGTYTILAKIKDTTGEGYAISLRGTTHATLPSKVTVNFGDNTGGDIGFQFHTTDLYTLNSWNHIFVYFDRDDRGHVYLNGVKQVASSGSSDGMSAFGDSTLTCAPDISFLLGALPIVSGSPTQFYDGRLDSCHVFLFPPSFINIQALATMMYDKGNGREIVVNPKFIINAVDVAVDSMYEEEIAE